MVAKGDFFCSSERVVPGRREFNGALRKRPFPSGLKRHLSSSSDGKEIGAGSGEREFSRNNQQNKGEPVRGRPVHPGNEKEPRERPDENHEPGKRVAADEGEFPNDEGAKRLPEAVDQPTKHNQPGKGRGPENHRENQHAKVARREG